LNRLPNYRGKVTLELAPKGDRFEVEVYPISTSKARVLQVAGLKHEFAVAFAEARDLFVADGKSRTKVPISGAWKAYTALQECVSDTLPQWGVDPKAFARLKRPPTEIEGKFWISGADYPADAWVNWQGYLVVRLNVDATGDVTECAVVVSSGWKSVDGLTCKNAVGLAKYHPAVGSDGKPISAVRTANLVFRLEG
jgi:Gram-negative bacterial TonB protein C-terminal